MKKLIMATQNPNKLIEIRAMLPEYELLGLTDVGILEDIPENEPTLEGNALTKARYLHNKLGVNCFADDTGLEVQSLNGEPGVFSARYAGPQKNAEDNMTLLLNNLKAKEDRTARFRTAIALILDSQEYIFEGIVNGSIVKERQGTEGFGYDPIFMPDGYDITFAQMPLDEKNRISHRGRAVQKLVDFLSNT